jgi:urease accessory protein
MRSIVHRIRAAGTAFGVGVAAAGPSLAHGPADSAMSFAAGFSHPLNGLDHILVMLAVGLWSVLAGGRAIWVWPIAFVATMLVGFLAATLGLQLPGVGAVISSSMVVLGILVALAVRAPVWAGAVVVALFAFFHGHAHGTEATAVNLLAYGSGFALATAGLHGAGITLALLAERLSGEVAVRAAGALTLVSGIALLAG